MPEPQPDDGHLLGANIDTQVLYVNPNQESTSYGAGVLSTLVSNETTNHGRDHRTVLCAFTICSYRSPGRRCDVCGRWYVYTWLCVRCDDAPRLEAATLVGEAAAVLGDRGNGLFWSSDGLSKTRILYHLEWRRGNMFLRQTNLVNP